MIVCKFSFTLLLASLFTIGFAQQSPHTIPVVMTNDVGSGPFLPWAGETQLYKGENFFRNMPENIVSFRIKKISDDPGLPELYIFYGINRENERVVIFDADFDKDLKNETKYIFGQDVSYKKDSVRHLIDSIPPVEIRYPGIPSIFLKPSVFNCCIKYLSKEDSAWHLELYTNYYRKGAFKQKNQSYQLELSGSVSPVFRKDLADFYLEKADTIPEKSNDNILTYKLKSTVYVDNREFVIDSLSKYGDTVWVVYNGKVDSAFGGRVGLFAKPIQTQTLKMRAFNLASLRGDFVLLDFWGTWCGPCIKLIPELVALHKKYGNKVKFVSVAYDKKQNYEKLKKMVKDKHMNWTHLFTDEDTLNNISDQYEVSCYPTSILIDPQGKIVFRGCGSQNFTALTNLLSSYFNSE
ncbi:MAG: TlpA family protein disulfide reductase [Chitinophagaceae bacterium]|nr:TlpA family protein disulfide reductase [Chitinophagaceae bacterium]